MFFSFLNCILLLSLRSIVGDDSCVSNVITPSNEIGHYVSPFDWSKGSIVAVAPQVDIPSSAYERLHAFFNPPSSPFSGLDFYIASASIVIYVLLRNAIGLCFNSSSQVGNNNDEYLKDAWTITMEPDFDSCELVITLATIFDLPQVNSDKPATIPMNIKTSETTALIGPFMLELEAAVKSQIELIEPFMMELESAVNSQTELIEPFMMELESACNSQTELIEPFMMELEATLNSQTELIEPFMMELEATLNSQTELCQAPQSPSPASELPLEPSSGTAAMQAFTKVEQKDIEVELMLMTADTVRPDNTSDPGTVHQSLVEEEVLESAALVSDNVILHDEPQLGSPLMSPSTEASPSSVSSPLDSAELTPQSNIGDLLEPNGIKPLEQCISFEIPHKTATGYRFKDVNERIEELLSSLLAIPAQSRPIGCSLRSKRSFIAQSAPILKNYYTFLNSCQREIRSILLNFQYVESVEQELRPEECREASKMAQALSNLAEDINIWIKTKHVGLLGQIHRITSRRERMRLLWDESGPTLLEQSDDAIRHLTAFLETRDIMALDMAQLLAEQAKKADAVVRQIEIEVLNAQAAPPQYIFNK